MVADDNPTKTPRAFAKGIALVVAAVLFVKIADPLLSARSAEVTLEDTHNIPATCSTDLTGRTRSGVPDDVAPNSCGAVYTSLGLFKLVESGSLNPLAMRREDMVAVMKSSCRYRIWFSGTGPMPTPEARGANKLYKTIFRMTPLDDCAAPSPSP